MNKKKLTVLMVVLIMMLIAIVTSLIIRSKAIAETLPAGEIKYYQIEVEYGKTLWSIALEYKPENYSVKEYIKDLKRLNHIEGDQIIAGTTLTVYSIMEKESGLNETTP